MNFIVNDERLEKRIEEAQALGHHKTKEEAVTVALQEYISHIREAGVLNGSIRNTRKKSKRQV